MANWAHDLLKSLSPELPSATNRQTGAVFHLFFSIHFKPVPPPTVARRSVANGAWQAHDAGGTPRRDRAGAAAVAAPPARRARVLLLRSRVRLGGLSGAVHGQDVRPEGPPAPPQLPEPPVARLHQEHQGQRALARGGGGVRAAHQPPERVAGAGAEAPREAARAPGWTERRPERCAGRRPRGQQAEPVVGRLGCAARPAGSRVSTRAAADAARD